MPLCLRKKPTKNGSLHGNTWHIVVHVFLPSTLADTVFIIATLQRCCGTRMLICTCHQERTQIFIHTVLERADHQYLNGQHLVCEVQTEIYEVLTKNGLSFMYKMIHGIISMPRADSATPIILVSILGFSKMMRPNLKPKPTADIECVRSWSEVCSWHGECMHKVRSWHVMSTPAFMLKNLTC